MVGWLLGWVVFGASVEPPAAGAAEEPPAAVAAAETPPAQTQPAPTSRPAESPLPPELASLAETLGSPEAAARRSAIAGLLESGDPRVIPALVRALGRPRPDRETQGKEWDQERVLVVMGIVSAFPEEALAAFKGALHSGNPTQREAATFGLGQLPTDAAIEVLLPLLRDDQPEVRRAAAVSVIVQARPAVDEAMRSVNGQGPGVSAESLGRLKALRGGLAHAADTPAAARELSDLIRKVGDRDLAARVTGAYCSSLGEEGAELASRLRKMFESNRRWLGRCELVPVPRVHYRFEMQNLVAGKGKSFPVTFTPNDQDVLRYRGYYLDRGTHLELPLDELLSNPAACDPRIVEPKDGQPRIRYSIPPRAGLTVSMGAMNIAYWQGKCFQATYSIVTLDPERWVPVREEFFAETGEMLANLDYSGYVDIAPGAWVPLALHAELLATDAPRRHMLYDLSFAIVEPGVWLFRAGVAQEVTEEAIEPRATAQLSGIEVTPR